MDQKSGAQSAPMDEAEQLIVKLAVRILLARRAEAMSRRTRGGDGWEEVVEKWRE